jgi:hypothetical protein
MPFAVNVAREVGYRVSDRMGPEWKDVKRSTNLEPGITGVFTSVIARVTLTCVLV